MFCIQYEPVELTQRVDPLKGAVMPSEIRAEVIILVHVVLTTLNLRVNVFWNVTPCGLVNRNQNFRETYRHHLLSQQMEGVDPPEVLLPVLQAAVTQYSLPSETQICFSSSFEHILNLRRFS